MKVKVQELFKFFLDEINLNVWIKVLIKFILHLFILLSEILFLSTFFLILNKKIDSQIFTYFYENLEIYFFSIFKN